MKSLGSPTRATTVVLLALAFCLLPEVARGAETEEAPFGNAVESAKRSLVLVRSCASTEETPEEQGITRADAVNTGFLVNENGLVLTSTYAVSGCNRIEVVSCEGKRSRAELVALDQGSALVLLQTELRPSMPFPFRQSPPEVGQWVLCALAGPSLEEQPVVVLKPGVLISRRGEARVHGLRWSDLLLVSAAGETSAASAPMLDRHGELAGVLLAQGHIGNVPSQWYVIPVQSFEQILQRLKQGEQRRLSWLGVGLYHAPEADALLVRSVIVDSPAHRAGIKPGDSIVSIDNMPARRPTTLQDKIATAEAGSEVVLEVLRGGKSRHLKVVLDQRPLSIAHAGLSGSQLARWQGSSAAQWPAYRSANAERVWEQVTFELQRQNQILHRRLQYMERRLQRIEQSKRE